MIKKKNLENHFTKFVSRLSCRTNIYDKCSIRDYDYDNLQSRNWAWLPG